MNNKTELELLRDVNQGLTEQCERLPESTLGRLQEARHRVLCEATTEPKRFFRQTLLGMPFAPLSAALSVGVLSAVLLLMPGSPLHNYSGETRQAGESGDTIDDVDVLMSNEDMEFLENLEIYEWLDAEYG